MSTKVNTPKYILGVVMVVLLVVGGWATTTARLTTTRTTASTAAKGATPQPRPLSPFSAVDPRCVFQLDGDIAAATGSNPAPGPASGCAFPTNADWSAVNCNTDGVFGGSTARSGVVVDGIGLSIFTGGGSKDPQEIFKWKWKDGSVPPKDEILNAYAARYGNVLVFGGERIFTSGASDIGCWFFVNPVAPLGDGTFTGSHTGSLSAYGDILILSEYAQGGAQAVSKVFAWVGTGGDSGGGTLQDITPLPGGSPAVYSISNADPIPTAQHPCWTYTNSSGGSDIPANAFFEGGIDLGAPEFGALAGSCFASFLVETRSSPSVGATLKDFVLGNLQECNVGCSKTANPTSVCAGESTTYTYTIPNTNSVALTVTAVDDNGTPLNSADDFSPFDSSGGCAKSAAGTSFVLAGGATATCTLPSGPLSVTTTNTLHVTTTGGGAPCDSSATVTVKDTPTCSIAGPDPVCGGTTNTYTSTVLPAGGTVTHLWSISSGNGTIVGSTTDPSVSVLAGASGSFTVTDNASRDGCLTSCSKTVTINPIPTVTITKDLACATSNLQLTANVLPAGGTTVTFSWSGPGIVSGGSSATVTVSSPGTYTVNVTRNGCSAAAVSATVGLCCSDCSP
jgi:PKD domain